MFLIRADANAEIATGHIMRCMTIADALCKKGQQVTFLTADHGADALLSGRGFSSICLDTKWDDCAGELARVKEVLFQTGAKKLLVDSYAVTDDYLRQLEEITKVIYLDDMGQIGTPVSLLINYNSFANRAYYPNLPKECNTRFLFGERYAPLREEFRDSCITFGKQPRAVFISTGGADRFHLAVKLLEKIQSERRLDAVQFHVVVGSMSSDLERLTALARETGNFTIHSNVTHMAQLMRGCDLAVSACGFTMYELCACGLPILTFSFAKNQRPGVKAFEKKGAAINCGDYGRDGDAMLDRVIDDLITLLSNPALREKMHQRAVVLVDGRGSERMTQEILSI